MRYICHAIVHTHTRRSSQTTTPTTTTTPHTRCAYLCRLVWVARRETILRRQTSQIRFVLLRFVWCGVGVRGEHSARVLLLVCSRTCACGARATVLNDTSTCAATEMGGGRHESCINNSNAFVLGARGAGEREQRARAATVTRPYRVFGSGGPFGTRL